MPCSHASLFVAAATADEDEEAGCSGKGKAQKPPATTEPCLRCPSNPAAKADEDEAAGSSGKGKAQLTFVLTELHASCFAAAAKADEDEEAGSSGKGKAKAKAAPKRPKPQKITEVRWLLLR